MKRKAVNNLTKEPIKILGKQTFTEKSTNNLKTENTVSIRQNVYNYKNLRDTQIVLTNLTTITNKNEVFLLINDLENSITVTILKLIYYREKIFMGRTLPYCP